MSLHPFFALQNSVSLDNKLANARQAKPNSGEVWGHAHDWFISCASLRKVVHINFSIDAVQNGHFEAKKNSKSAFAFILCQENENVGRQNVRIETVHPEITA